MRTILLATLLLFSACKKKDEAKPAATTKIDNQPGAPAATSAEAPTTPEPPLAGAVTIASAVEYEKGANDMTDKLLAIFAAGGKNCDKLASDVSAFAAENRALFAGLRAFEKANPEAEKAFDQKMNSRAKEFEQKLTPAFNACGEHAGLKKAMDSLPMD